MKTIDLGQTTLDACILDAQGERILLTRDGKPVALLVGIEGLDAEELELANDASFWTLIAERRTQKTFSRAEFEQSFDLTD